jgi:hypothetical protein
MSTLSFFGWAVTLLAILSAAAFADAGFERRLIARRERILAEAAASCGEEFYAVLSPNGSAGVIFQDEDDALWTATGSGGGFGVPTVGDCLRRCYPDQVELRRVKVIVVKTAERGAV